MYKTQLNFNHVNSYENSNSEGIWGRKTTAIWVELGMIFVKSSIFLQEQPMADFSRSSFSRRAG